MLKLIGELPERIHVACSGGVDSMAVLDFIRRGKRHVTAVYFDHGTEHSRYVRRALGDYCESRSIELIVGRIEREKKKDESQEEYWRNERYRFFDSLDVTIITAHHLDDAVETYLFSSFHGTSKTIPYNRKKVIRPFLLTRKSEFEAWCANKNVPYWSDASNKDLRFARNRIRHAIMPEVLRVNPGIHKVVAKMINANALAIRA